jgi:hypothetical protein
VAGSCEYGDEPSCSGDTELITGGGVVVFAERMLLTSLTS